MKSIHYALYQVKKERCREIGFMSLKHLQQQDKNYTPKQKDYSLVYVGIIEANSKNEGLEELFYKFNMCHPEGYTGRSLSVSDVVILTVDEIETKWFCDSIGWVQVEFEEKEGI